MERQALVKPDLLWTNMDTENVYRITDYHHPFDSYMSQPVIVFEEKGSTPCCDACPYRDKIEA